MAGKIKKVSLIGLGAMGVWFAPGLYEQFQNNFRVVAGGERKKRLEEAGVTINGINYKFPIITPEEEGDTADLIIIAVKGYGLDQAIADIRNQVGAETLILSVLNGVDSEEKVIAAFGEEHVLYSYMRVSIVMKDGIADFDRKLGCVHFGEKRNEEYSDKVLAVKDVFDACGLNYVIDEDMVRGIWFKFMCNVGENLTCAMLGVPFGAFKSSANANHIRKAAMKEVAAIAQKRGIDIGEEDMQKQEATLKAIPSKNKPSTLQDLEAGKRTEIDMFAGTVIKMGKECGIATPVNDMLYSGIKVLEEKSAGEIEGLLG